MKKKYINLVNKSKWLRSEIFEMVVKVNQGHIASSLSQAEILISLYYSGILNIKKKDPKYKELTDHILAGLKMMAEMGTPPSQVADVIMKAIHSDEILPRYIVGTDAAMFMEAKQAKTDLEFEKYMSKELFPG